MNILIIFIATVMPYCLNFAMIYWLFLYYEIHKGCIWKIYVLQTGIPVCSSPSFVIRSAVILKAWNEGQSTCSEPCNIEAGDFISVLQDLIPFLRSFPVRNVVWTWVQFWMVLEVWLFEICSVTWKEGLHWTIIHIEETGKKILLYSLHSQ
jgi:hypothetical protein